MIPESELRASLLRCKSAARKTRAQSTASKNQVLSNLAFALVENEGRILEANARDLELLAQDAEQDGARNLAFRERLTLTPSRIAQMAESLRQVAVLEDPVGEVVEAKTLANGLKLRRVRSPLGVIFMIFESRPNVAVEAFSLAFKSGNVMILRGGKESLHTVSAIYSLIRSTLSEAGFDPDSLWGIEDPDRQITEFLLARSDFIDVVVPRGGEALIDYVVRNSRIPIIKNDRGMCHVYVHEDADPAMAQAIVTNAKTQRPGVCNAVETLLVHRDIASSFVPNLYDELLASQVQWFACQESLGILRNRSNVFLAGEKSWDTEYLDYKLNCKIVGSLEEAIFHIEQHGSRHSEAIVTKSESSARKFQEEVDAAAVYWNASTRFTDGFEMGLGGELGISTQKLHVRGPVGLRELTSVRWIADGSGQIRKG